MPKKIKNITLEDVYALGVQTNNELKQSTSALTKELAATKKQAQTNNTIIKQVLVKVAENLEKIDKHENTINKLLASQFRMERDLQEIKETIKCIPQLYNNMDAFVKEVLGYRHEQTFVNKRLDEHEDRLEVLEQKQLPFAIA